jgi:putative DNA primase/helicase
MEALSSNVTAFLRDRCEVGEGHEVEVDDLWLEWRRWCEGNGRKEPGIKQLFGRDLHAAVPGLEVYRPRTGEGGKQVPTYKGLRILPA